MHAHLPIRHLIRHLTDRRDKSGQSALPTEMIAFIDRVSQLFEPFGGVARAGYECRCGDDRWEISLFLGEIESVGGALDGELIPINFRFDVRALLQQFDRVDTLSWNAIPNSHVASESDRFESFLTLEGLAGPHRISLQVHALAPDTIGPAIREHADGRLELA